MGQPDLFRIAGAVFHHQIAEEEIIIEEDNKEDNADVSAEAESDEEVKKIIKRYLKCNSCGNKKDYIKCYSIF